MIHTGARSRSLGPTMLTGVASGCFASNLYRDRLLGHDAAKILPGEYFVTAENMVIVTVLGSCVSACIRDTASGIGGMNHFMLPVDERAEADGESPPAAARYGGYAMGLLIHHLLELGARRENLEAKVFGGGNVLPGISTLNVGERNAEFVLGFLNAEQIRVAARDLVDSCARKIYFFPATGLVRVKRLLVLHNSTVRDRDVEYRRRLARLADGDAQ